jgi:hypothetical protein
LGKVDGLEWVEQLEKIPGMPPMVARLWKARVQLEKGIRWGAVTAREGVKAATDAENDEYTRLNTEVVAEVWN